MYSKIYHFLIIFNVFYPCSWNASICYICMVEIQSENLETTKECTITKDETMICSVAKCSWNE